MQRTSAIFTWSLDCLEAITRLRGFQLLRRFEPAFIVFTVIGVVLATYTLQQDREAQNHNLAALHEERISRAWQTVTREARGNSGKSEALEFLNANDHVLDRINVSPNSVRKDGEREFLACNYRVFLPNLDLSEARANGAKLSCTDMDADAPQLRATFKEAFLEGAKFLRVNAENGDFHNAILTSADFRGAQLGKANFAGAQLAQARFEYANLRSVDFEGTTLAPTQHRYQKSHNESVIINRSSQRPLTGKCPSKCR